jgi:hypothetical protein
MTVNQIKRLAASVVAVAALAIMAAPAQAAFSLRITDVTGGASAVVNDQNAPPGTLVDFNPNVNGIVTGFNFLVGSFRIDSNQASAMYGGPISNISFNNFNVANTTGAARVIRLEVSATDYTSPFGDVNFLGSGTVGITLGMGESVSGTITGYDDPSNTLFGTGANILALPGVSVTQASPTYSSGLQTTTFFGLPIPYAKTIVAEFTVSANAEFDIDANFTNSAVPEPATFLSAVPLLVGALWLRRRKMA